MRSQRHLAWIAVGPAVGVIVIALTTAIAGQVTTLNQFQPNTTADAHQVNANFQQCAQAIQDNDTRIATLEQTPSAIRLVRGIIGEDDSLLAGSGFTLTVNRYGTTAEYDVTFDTPFTSLPVIVASVDDFEWELEAIPLTRAEDGFRLRLYAMGPVSGTVDSRWSFIACSSD